MIPQPEMWQLAALRMRIGSCQLFRKKYKSTQVYTEYTCKDFAIYKYTSIHQPQNSDRAKKNTSDANKTGNLILFYVFQLMQEYQNV